MYVHTSCFKCKKDYSSHQDGNNMKKNKTLLIKIIYVAIFASLSFVGTMISIPIGASKVHLGNFVCILSGLLCGGLIGGLSGSLGMGLNDIVFGYPYTTYLRTFVLKFLMGFLVGTIFRALVKHRINGKILNWITTFVIAGLFTYILIMFFQEDSSYNWVILLLAGILLLLVLFISIFTWKKDETAGCLSFSLMVALSVNVLGEFFTKLIVNMSLGLTYEVALTESIARLPGSLLTSIVTIVLTITIYYPLYKATHKINQVNDLEGLIPYRTKKKEERKVQEKTV